MRGEEKMSAEEMCTSKGDLSHKEKIVYVEEITHLWKWFFLISNLVYLSVFVTQTGPINRTSDFLF